MSKKSRRRNKKILAALALAGGAALMAKRGKGVAQGVSGADKAAFTSDAAYKLPSKAAVAADIAQDVVKPDTKIDYSKGNWKGFGHPIIQGNIQKKNEYIKRNTIPGYGSAVAPPGILNPYRRPRGGGHPLMQGRTTNYKKGGRVTGIAKRGFGRALMKGKK